MRAYLDNLATTPLDGRVLGAMEEVWRGPAGNPHARAHAFGVEAAERLERARAEVARVVGARPGEVLFVPSATVANNLAVIGGAERRRKRGRHVLVSAIEHASVLEPAREMARRGFEVEEVPVGPDGVVDPDAVRARLRPDTVLVSVMAVNNEVGTVQPVAEVAAVVREHGAWLHCDAAQAPGKVALAVAIGADLVTLSGHKAYGPSGCAALVARGGAAQRPCPLTFGGGQEGGTWPGTAAVALAVGLARALVLAEAEREADRAKVAGLRSALWDGLHAAWPGSRHNGPGDGRVVPHCLSVTFEGVEGETVMARLAAAGVAASFGSACSTDASRPSHVLTAMGLSPEEARRTVRFGLGRFTTREEVAYTVEVLAGLARDLGRGRG